MNNTKKNPIPFSHDDMQYDIEVYLVLKKIFHISNIDEISNPLVINERK
jgi:hypothetical protein